MTHQVHLAGQYTNADPCTLSHRGTPSEPWIISKQSVSHNQLNNQRHEQLNNQRYSEILTIAGGYPPCLYLSARRDSQWSTRASIPEHVTSLERRFHCYHEVFAGIHRTWQVRLPIPFPHTGSFAHLCTGIIMRSKSPLFLSFVNTRISL